MTYYNIAPALLSFFLKDVNVLPAGLFTIAYYSDILIQTCVWPFPKSFRKVIASPKSYKFQKSFRKVIYFISLQVEKKNHSLRTQLAAEHKWIFITIAAAFVFVNVLLIILVNEK